MSAPTKNVQYSIFKKDLKLLEIVFLVDEIVIGAPPATDKNFMELYRIDTVVASKEYSKEILRKY